MASNTWLKKWSGVVFLAICASMVMVVMLYIARGFGANVAHTVVWIAFGLMSGTIVYNKIIGPYSTNIFFASFITMLLLLSFLNGLDATDISSNVITWAAFISGFMLSLAHYFWDCYYAYKARKAAAARAERYWAQKNSEST